MTFLKLRAAAYAMAVALGRRAALPALLVVAGAGTAATGVAAAAEDAVLLASTAPGYAPGTVVAAGERLQLPEGASVTLLFRSGQMLRLRGPVETSLDLAPPQARREGLAATLAEAFRLRGVDASVIGGARAAGSVRMRPPPPGDVMVDVQRSGTYCVGPADTVWLARPVAATEPATLALRRRGNQRTLAWPAGAMRVEWPSDLPIEDGDRFDVLGEGTPLATLTFRAVAGGAPASEAAAVAEGVLLGCHEQHEAALRRLARAAVPPELWLTTDRGRASPVYRSGEPVVLTAVAATDGWLYCVSVRAGGTAVAVFPGGAAEGARLPGAMPVTIPGPRRGAAGLRAGPRGAERIRCWLADRDISPELPHALLGPVGARLPDRLAADLDATFAGAAGSRITGASLEIRVE